MIVGIGFSKKLADRFGKRDVFGAALFVSTLFLLAFLVYPPDRIGVVFVSQILHGFFYGITIPLLWAMIADVADYSEWKNNRRATAIIFSAMLCGLKLGLSIGGALVAGILAHYGYQAGAPAQAAATVDGIRLSISLYASLPFLPAWCCCSSTKSTKPWNRASSANLASAAPAAAPRRDLRRTTDGQDVPRRPGADERRASAARRQGHFPAPITHIYTADPSAHVFDGKLYIYCSHDIEGGVPFGDDGAHFCMEDYHVIALDSPHGPSTDCGLIAARERSAVGRSPDVGAGRGAEGRALLPLFPGQGARRPVPDRRGRGRPPGRSVQARARADRRYLLDRSGRVRR